MVYHEFYRRKRWYDFFHEQRCLLKALLLGSESKKDHSIHTFSHIPCPAGRTCTCTCARSSRPRSSSLESLLNIGPVIICLEYWTAVVLSLPSVLSFLSWYAFRIALMLTRPSSSAVGCSWYFKTLLLMRWCRSLLRNLLNTIFRMSLHHIGPLVIIPFLLRVRKGKPIMYHENPRKG